MVESKIKHSRLPVNLMIVTTAHLSWFLKKLLKSIFQVRKLFFVLNNRKIFLRTVFKNPKRRKDGG